MRIKYETRLTPGFPGTLLLVGLALAAGTTPLAPAWAQAAVDLDDGTHPAPVAPPAALTPAMPKLDGGDNIVDGIRVSNTTPDPAADKLVPTTTSPATSPTQPTTTTSANPTQPLPDPIALDHPQVLDTARLSANGKVVPLFGIVGQEGDAAKQLEAYLATANASLTCPAQTATDYVCLLPDGTDVAAVSLVNGAARTRDDAPDAYKAQEAAAREARRGIWANLPPPPDTVTHPTVRDTATLVSGSQTYILDGVTGLGQPYASQLQGYIAANGDRLTCQAQAVAGHYICIMDDGTDIAKVALVNGAAGVGKDAPDSYRLEQLDAVKNKRGVWVNPPPAFLTASASQAPATACCVYAAGDDGGDGIHYVGGEPTAVIDGRTVFLTLAGAAGWGYYDGEHHWRDAPIAYRTHMERFHPNGSGLRAYRAPIGYPVAVGVPRVGVGVGVGVPIRPSVGVGVRVGPSFFATHSSIYGRPGYYNPGPHVGFVRPMGPMGGGFRTAIVPTFGGHYRHH
jgi:endonuclease YncB( thermonuclease family)